MSIPVIDVESGENANDRIEALLAIESLNPTRQFWLSFCDADLPVGSQFLGVAIVSASGVASAARKAHQLGINPGGEVLAIELNPYLRIAEQYCDRLLTKAEAEAVIPERTNP